MSLKFADRLESNNPSAYGIVKAIEVAGHKTVSSLSALSNIPDCILSVSGNNTGNDALGQLWYVVDEGKIYQLVDWENRKSQEGWSEYGAENVTKEELEEALDKKQDKLIPGKGIEITEDNVINCTLDTQIFEFVDELPPLTEAKENKIYLVPKEENQGEYQVYVEYIVTDIIDEAGFPTKTWEKIGEYDLGIELAPYLKIADAEATYVKKSDIVNTLDGGTQEQVLGAQMGAELKEQLDKLSEDTVHSVTSTPGKGIIVEGTKNDPTVGILRDPGGEDFLTLGEAGLGVKGIQEAIDLGDNTVREEYKADLEEMQSHTEYLYDINSLFPGEGQGDAKDQWTLTRALSKLDALLQEEDRKSGIKMKFIDSNGEWITYTFYGGDLLDENNWAYDLTSKDFTELASQIPVATPDSNGMMSGEDKKKFDELKEGIEDGKSILDEITNAVQEAKDIIDAYTVNGYEISSNPVLGKADVGLDQVDNTSDIDKPVSIAQQEALDELQSHTEYLYNINILFPGEGEGDTKDQWGLQSAIVRLDASLTDEEKIPGVKVKFYTQDGKWRTYTFYGDSFTSPDSWSYDLTSEDFTELSTTDLPIATQTSNGTMSKEDKIKLDTLSDGIEDGVSIVDKINEIVGDTKEVIDAYTVNGYKISENPVLGKADVGLGNVDNTSDLDKPVSTAQRELLDQTKETIDSYTINGYKISTNPVLEKADVGLDQVDNTSDLDKPISNATQEKFDELESHTEVLYNINETFPGEGSGENKDQWNLQTAIARLDAILGPEQEKESLKIKFITEDGNWRTYTYYGKEGDSISNPDLWKYDLTSQDFTELATTNLPTATQEANGVMSKEDKKILDTLAEGMDEGVSIIDKIDEKVEAAKYIIDNYTVNGYKISENPVLGKADIGLGNVTNDAQVKRSEMGVQNGVATLDENGKVPTSQLPDAVLGNVRYMGVWDASLNEPLLENGNEEQNGHYYIVSNPGTQFGYDFDSGDWVINSAGTWSKVDNVDSVKSVNGQTGIVELKIEDIPDLRTELDQKVNVTDFNQTIQDLKDSTDTLYNVTDLFPGEGQTGENSEQWDLQHAVSKLDGTLGAEEKISGIKIKFIDEEGDWVTYTFNGGDFVSPDSWSYDLTSNDIDNLASLIPTATDSTSGLMSGEDKKKFDELKDGIEDGKSILDKIDEAVQEAKDVIGEYTVNGYKISSNPILEKADVGLDQVDNTSDIDKPISTATQEALDKIESQTDLVYNINSLFPGEGQGDTKDQWTIQTAVAKADSYIPDENKVPGTKIKFLDENGKWRTYTYYGEGNVFVDSNSWEYDLTSKDFTELATTDLPVATQEANGVMSKEDKKKLDILTEGFDGETSISDQITEKIEEAKTELNETIDNTKQELQGNIDKTNEDLSNHITDFNNPHQVTAEQVGLGNVTNDAQVKRSEMGNAQGVATLDENGKVPVSQLPGQVDEVFGIDHFVDSKTDISASRLVVGATYYVRDEKKIYTAISESELDEGKTPEKGVIYSNRETNIIYRWDGSDLIEVGNPVHIGETAGTAYPGDKGKETTDKLNSHLADTENPHQVTKDQVGLGNVDNTSDIDKPVSTAQQAALDKLNEDLSRTINTHLADYNNPHKVTKDQVGLGNVDNTADINKPVSTAQQAAIDRAKADLNASISENKSLIQNHIDNKSNPHEVNKSQVGLDKVDNTSDLEKPVSIPQQEAINAVKDSVTDLSTDFSNHLTDYSNPHRVTKDQVGLGKVDNTSDLEKPISTAVQDAINTLNTNIELAKTEIGNYTVSGHKISENPQLTKEDVGLGNVDNTSDINKPISHLTQDALDALEAKIDSIGQTTDDGLKAHLADYNNPHKVTKDQVGLGNVENLAPIDLPVSNAVQEAIDQVNSTVTATIKEHIQNTENPHQVTKTQIGLGNVTDDAQVKRTEMGVASGVATLDESGKVPSSQLPSFVDDVLEFDSLDEFPQTGETGKIYVSKDTNLTYRWSGSRYIEISSSLALGETSSTAYPGDKGKETADKVNSHIADFNNPHQVTAEQIGLGNVDNTSDIDKPVSTAQQKALDELKQSIETENAEISENLTTHIQDTENPHKVTKDQVGLGKVDNTSDLEKPISTAQQEAFSKVTEDITSVESSLNAHLADTENPHRVTAEQIGLGKVNNTSDLEKPISTAQQEALDKLNTKIETVEKDQEASLNAHLADYNNPHRVTKDQVGLGNVDNTADLDKPVSTATEKAISNAKAELNTALTSHINNRDNPHRVTKDQVGLGNVDNTSDINKPISHLTQDALDALQRNIDKLSETTSSELGDHIADFNNPHQVTAEQIGLGNVDNTSDLNKPISTATQEALDNITNKHNEDITSLNNRIQSLEETVTELKSSLQELIDALTLK